MKEQEGSFYRLNHERAEIKIVFGKCGMSA
jgi:hypothetical protein